MRKAPLVILMLIYFLAGCIQTTDQDTKGSENHNMIGYVVKKEEDRVLLVPSNDIKFGAVWVKTKENFSIGEQIEVLFEGDELLSSSPAQGVAKRIHVVRINTPGDPRHTAEEVLKKVLLQHEEWDVPIIKEIKYVPEDRIWSVILYDDKDPGKEEKEIIYND